MPAASVLGVMDPLQPPLPLASKFPFHPAAGSQYSILMSESLEGLDVTWTRQNAGRFSNPPPPPLALPFPPAGAGGAKAPAATDSAMIVVCGIVSEFKLSHEAPMACAGRNTASTNVSNSNPASFITLWPPLRHLTRKIRRFVNVAGTLVIRRLRIGAQRASPVCFSVPHARCFDAFRRLAALHPLLDRSQHIERIRPVAAVAVSHARHHEQPHG